FSPSASYRAFTVNFNGSTDVKMYYDWNGGGSNPTTSFMNVSYVVDGVSQALTYSSFGSLGNWTTSESAGLNSLAGQSDAVIDLSAVSGTITSITLDLVGMTPDSRVGFDNILVTGTAVIPEPSTYALLLGLVGLAFVCFRKKS
ncbi:MAG: PEP-CTERM sorting domain-containing protein, partial [Balneolaceae bacterium]|nr:PEP-CTERM sorting domain-containing protein [Balneolaceae bacterium]